MRARVPRVGRAILRRMLPPDVRDDVTGDLEEMFHRDCTAAGSARARLRYWRKVLNISARFAVERPRDAFSLLDVKLGLRMLGRYPGLTAVAVLGMAVAIAIAAGSFSILYTITTATLPFKGGDRVVAIQLWDAKTDGVERRLAHALTVWRANARTVGDISAFRNVTRNLIEPGRPTEAVRIAEMSPSGFRAAGVGAFSGRTLLDEDEHPEAPPVIVIGHDLWRDRYAGDPDILGRSLQVGSVMHTIVGVMPEGFAFPVSDSFWVPFKLDRSRFEPLTGPAIRVFGRLTEGVGFEAAQAEFEALDAELAAARPADRAVLRPMVLPYTYPFFDMNDPSVAGVKHQLQGLISTLLIIAAVNVAILVYARTATRHSELAVRTALGASRRRIVMQLFAEGLVLASAAAALGLVFAQVGLSQVDAAMQQVYPVVPFWWSFRLSPAAVMYVAGLTVLAASIVGVVPALKATARRARVDHLKSISAGGGGLQLGRTWTFLIVGQVAFAVALLPMMLFGVWDATRRAVREPAPETYEFVTADLLLEQPLEPPAGAAFMDRYAARHTELHRRLLAEPGVSAVTFAAEAPLDVPAMDVEVEGATGSVGFHRVDPGFLPAFGQQVLAGRGLEAADASRAAGSVVVNRTFVDEILGGSPALGRRVRYLGGSREVEQKLAQTFGKDRAQRGQTGQWYEIVGVVADYRIRTDGANAAVYHAADFGEMYPLVVAIRIPGGAPPGFAARLAQLAAAVDPEMQVRGVTTEAQVLRSDQRLWKVMAGVLVGIASSIMGLVAAGIYAMMSFTVSRRRREIGIRAALGANPRRILGSIFARALRQLAFGAAVGAAAAVLIDIMSEGGTLRGNGAIVLPLVALFMMIVGVAAAAGPARRGLKIQPVEALRES